MRGYRTTICGLIFASSSFVSAQDVCDGVEWVRQLGLRSEVVVEGLDQPVHLASPPGDVDRIFIVERGGTVLVKQKSAPVDEYETFLDIRDVVDDDHHEAGMLSIAFDPEYDLNGYFYLYYTQDIGDLTSFVSRFSVDPQDPNRALPESLYEIIRFEQPRSTHNGGQIHFGPSGYLHISTGDGGGGGDPHGTCGNGQRTSTLLGKILRIDVRSELGAAPDCGEGNSNYVIPTDNPMIDGAGGDCDEVYAYGLRNPWRFSIDAHRDRVYIGDVGQSCWEEINVIARSRPGAENFGWRQMEGGQCFDPDHATDCEPDPVDCPSSPDCNDPELTLPTIGYSNTGGNCAVVGGYAYRGCRLGRYQGVYFYGDVCKGSIWAVRISDTGRLYGLREMTHQIDPLGRLRGDLVGFGVDGQGELYILDYDGEIRLILPPEVGGRARD